MYLNRHPPVHLHGVETHHEAGDHLTHICRLFGLQVGLDQYPFQRVTLKHD
ncbi:unnamed protein product [Nyctereutes procyonoides]|uniref:(raccoon dog) hypothetical protein n=1 Tax=Nyctereutes procyonoides TaxID=34880 RepID=A0A811Y3H6_NYCPR|nr:unnamed protein product [Nyctereutes procyonoides]